MHYKPEREPDLAGFHPHNECYVTCPIISSPVWMDGSADVNQSYFCVSET
jgi:hypothetical protein